MKNVLKCLLVGLGLSSMAHAGSMGSNPKQLDGFFFGGYVGAGWNQNTSFQTTILPSSSPYIVSQANVALFENNASSGTTFSAPVGGGQVGFLKQWNKIVYGVVADYGVFNFTSTYAPGNQKYYRSDYTYNFSTSLSSNWLFTTRGRLSYVFDDRLPLIYGFGGLAVSKIQVSNSFTDNKNSLGVGNSTNQKTVAGFTVGAGVEYLLLEHLLMNLEYLYINLPSVNTTAYTSSTNSATFTMSPMETAVGLTANIIRVGLSYKF